MIYFMQAPTGGLIKIGLSRRISDRRKNLSYEHGELIVLGVVDGTHTQEAALHKQFSSLCEKKEWFRPEEELLTFIREHARPWDGKDELPPR